MLLRIEISYKTFFLWTSDQVRVLPIHANFVGFLPLFELRILEIHIFPHFSHTCFDMLSWHFVSDFLMNCRSSSRVNFCKSTVTFGIKNFLLHASMNWDFGYDFLFMDFRSSSSVSNLRKFFVGVLPLYKIRISEIYSLSYMQHILSFDELQLKWLSLLEVKFEGVMAPSYHTVLAHAVRLSWSF